MRVSAKQYAQTLFELVKESPTDVSAVVQKFAESMYAKGDAKKVPDTLTHFSKIVDEHDKIVQVEIKSAEKDPKGLPEEINGKKAIYAHSHDPSLIGGYQMKVNDTFIDNSIKTKLNELRNAITSHE